MELNDKVKYWIKISDYDLETAEAMLETKRLLYVGFMCHQSIEKILKVYYVKIKDETPPYIHNLLVLSEKTDLMNSLSEAHLDFITKLNPLNIKGRYPHYKEMIFKELNKKDCKKIIQETKEFIECIKKKL